MTRRSRRTDRWRHDSHNALALGCQCCWMLQPCGGLRIKRSAYDCGDFCCRGADLTCTRVCLHNPEYFAARVAEVGGFENDDIARVAPVSFNRLDGYVPLLQHGFSRRDLLKANLVSLKLYDLIDPTGRPRFRSQQDILNHFRLRPGTKLILSGIHHEEALEKLWRSPYRAELIENLRTLDLALLTSPNFSIVLNHPRTEHLYNTKRIWLLAYEFLAAGIPTAVHINACTERAYERATQFLIDRKEFDAISFEFITGANASSRMEWHASKLIELSKNVGRPLQLALRGGVNVLHKLARAYEHIVLTDSEPFMKAINRQRLVIGNNGRTLVRPSPLLPDQPVDELLEGNIRSHTHMIDLARAGELPAIHKPVFTHLRRARDGDHDPRQFNLLLDLSGCERRANSGNDQRVIPASNSQKARKI